MFVSGLLILVAISAVFLEPAMAYTRTYGFTSFTDASDSWGRYRVVYVSKYPNGIPENAVEPYFIPQYIYVNNEANAFDGDWTTYVEGKSVEPVWAKDDTLLCGKTGWLTLRMPYARFINHIDFKYSSALAGKAITIQVYNARQQIWRTVYHGVCPGFDFDPPNSVDFHSIYTNRVRVRIETGEDGPCPWNGSFSVHGAYLYELQPSYRSG